MATAETQGGEFYCGSGLQSVYSWPQTTWQKGLEENCLCQDIQGAQRGTDGAGGDRHTSPGDPPLSPGPIS